ncbi:unnamed protein product, partial [Ectocarpus fasciculatus]
SDWRPHPCRPPYHPPAPARGRELAASSRTSSRPAAGPSRPGSNACRSLISTWHSCDDGTDGHTCGWMEDTAAYLPAVSRHHLAAAGRCAPEAELCSSTAVSLTRRARGTPRG